ncbi:MAG: hypothetical protein NVSMB14_02420 [Isosphaeraceae bacterium]
MASAKKGRKQVEDPAKIRDEWLRQLADLMSLTRGWAEELDWSTRLIDKEMEDSRLGTYEAPALLMQRETTRVLLDPVARFTPGTDGFVDLYLMPAYDDIASLYRMNGEWRLHYVFPGFSTAPTIKEAEFTPLSKEAFSHVLNKMSKHAATTRSMA